mmetsp:Transcript_39699/g.63682  ORF Transcript_39699/g.63682 Transcript_39699/m.63682 type:complete len:88 (+) Transcript_39699:769-1032(+)
MFAVTLGKTEREIEKFIKTPQAKGLMSIYVRVEAALQRGTPTSLLPDLERLRTTLSIVVVEIETRPLFLFTDGERDFFNSSSFKQSR